MSFFVAHISTQQKLSGNNFLRFGDKRFKNLSITALSFKRQGQKNLS
jgi:hypothetical protein